jgi:hypothetical protein
MKSTRVSLLALMLHCPQPAGGEELAKGVVYGGGEIRRVGDIRTDGETPVQEQATGDDAAGGAELEVESSGSGGILNGPGRSVTAENPTRGLTSRSQSRTLRISAFFGQFSTA